jgi:DNA-binding SARP family transcriptional activator
MASARVFLKTTRVDFKGTPTLNLLGQFALRAGDEPVSLPGDAQRLVAFLAIRGCRLPRALIAGNLWLEHNEDRALGNLRSALWRVRKQIDGLLDCDSTCVAIAKSTSIDVELVNETAARLSDCRRDWSDADLVLQPFRADLLPGWYDEWVLVERERIRQQALHALEAIAERLTTMGHHGAAAQAALCAIEKDPLRESAHRCLVRVHLAEGNRSEALRQFWHYENLIGAELGVSPSNQMTELFS